MIKKVERSGMPRAQKIANIIVHQEILDNIQATAEINTEFLFGSREDYGMEKRRSLILEISKKDGVFSKIGL